MKKRWLIAAILPVLWLACSEAESPVKESDPPTPTELVQSNTLAVRDAAEAFAAENNGLYPRSFTDKTPSDKTLIDFLPGASQLTNPFTQHSNLPLNLTAFEPGATAYRAFWEWDETNGWQPVGYVITGADNTGIIVRYEKGDTALLAKERAVVDNCILVAAAAELFAAQTGGLYPSDIGVDTTPGGSTLTDLLPDGHLLENPFWEVNTEPKDGAAAVQGETGYQPTSNGTIIVGYLVTGHGNFNTIVEFDRCPTCED